MRISDWSSDVCSSDLPLVRVNASWMELFTLYADGDDLRARFIVHLSDFTTDGSLAPEAVDRAFLERSVREAGDLRSEERRVGKEGVSTWSFRWSPYH